MRSSLVVKLLFEFVRIIPVVASGVAVNLLTDTWRPPPYLKALVIIGLLIIAAVANLYLFVKEHKKNDPTLSSPGSTAMQFGGKAPPKSFPLMTAIGWFAIVIAFGNLIGAILIVLFPPDPFLRIHTYEWIGIGGGVAFFSLFVFLKNGFWAAGLIVPYYLGLAMAVLSVRPLENDLVFTCSQYFLSCFISTVVFIIVEFKLMPFRENRIKPAIGRLIESIKREMF